MLEIAKFINSLWEKYTNVVTVVAIILMAGIPYLVCTIGYEELGYSITIFFGAIFVVFHAFNIYYLKKSMK